MPIPTELHGPIPLGPKGNRVYFGYGTSRAGVVQIVDRKKLLEGPKEPTDANLLFPQIARLDLPPDAGAHTAFPLLGMTLPEFAKQKFPVNTPAPGSGHDHGEAVAIPTAQAHRDFIAVVSESLANECQEPRQMVRMVDITFESSPVGISTWTVPRGERRLLRPRRPLRLAFLTRELCAGLLRSRAVRHVFQRRPSRAGHPRSVQREGDRLLHSGDDKEYRPTLRRAKVSTSAARSRSSRTTSRLTSAATSMWSIAPTPACTSSSLPAAHGESRTTRRGRTTPRVNFQLPNSNSQSAPTFGIESLELGIGS